MGAATESDLHRFLQKVFGCAPEVAARIAARAKERRYPAKAIILKQGDRADVTFLLVAGRVHALSYSPGGQMVLLGEFLPGDFFGAIAHAAPAPQSADAVAAEDSYAAAFPALEFLSLIETYGCVAIAVCRTLLKQLHAMSARMVESTTLSAAGRVHAELLRLAGLADGRTVRPAPVLAALAIRVNSTRETVSRTISALERRGIVRREADALVIVAPRRLEEMIV